MPGEELVAGHGLGNRRHLGRIRTSRRTRDRERKLLKKVEQALGRIESGDYGWCEETGEPIGLNRLIARPTANLSLEAQERRELRQKLFGE